MMNSLRSARVFSVVVALALTGCVERTVAPESKAERRFAVAPSDVKLLAAPTGDAAAYLKSMNVQLAKRGVAVREASMSFAPNADPRRASIVVANDRRHREGYRFVTNDPRRPTPNGFVRQSTFSLLAIAPTSSGFVLATPSIDAAFATWTDQKCSRLQIVNNTLGANIFPSALVGFGGFINDPLASDVNTIGFLPGVIFDFVLGPGASTSVVGVTFPFVWIDQNGVPTDIDRDGNDDLAFAEIWYNADLVWSNTGTGNAIDIESAALHETGHALGLGHFGKVTVNTSKGTVHAAPRAVMNAFILGTLREPRGTDNASFCSLWAKFPK